MAILSAGPVNFLILEHYGVGRDGFIDYGEVGKIARNLNRN